MQQEHTPQRHNHFARAVQKLGADVPELVGAFVQHAQHRRLPNSLGTLMDEAVSPTNASNVRQAWGNSKKVHSAKPAEEGTSKNERLNSLPKLGCLAKCQKSSMKSNNLIEQVLSA